MPKKGGSWCNKFIKDKDVFGYQVNFKIEGAAAKKNSILGGLCSIAALSFILFHTMKNL